MADPDKGKGKEPIGKPTSNASAATSSNNNVGSSSSNCSSPTHSGGGSVTGGKYPPPSPESDKAAQLVKQAMEAKDSKGRPLFSTEKCPAVGVLVHSDGKVTVCVSGGRAAGDAVEKLKALQKEGKLPANFEIGEASMQHPEKIEPADHGNGKMIAKTQCAEPKLFESAQGKAPVTAMSVAWRGEEANDYPRDDNAEFMKPCPSCTKNEGKIVGNTPLAPPSSSGGTSKPSAESKKEVTEHKE